MSSFDMVQVENRPQIILLLRTNPSWAKLCEAFGIDPYGQYSTITDALYADINELRDLDILEFEGDPRVDPPQHDRISVSQRWMKLQTALGVSLHDLVRTSRNGQGLAVTPLFGRPSKTVDHPDVFVIMPFKPEYDAVYEHHVKKVVDHLQLSVRRADERLDSGPIMRAIWEDIFYSQIVLADVSDRNVNVYYELGIVHTLGKPTVMIKRAGESASFDIAGLRWIEYEYTPPGMLAFESQLTAVIENAITK